MSSKTPKKFVGLHAHSGYSTSDGLGPPSQHIDYVLENGMDAHTFTEHGHMNGLANAALYAKKLKAKGINFKFIPGAELYVHPDLAKWRAEKQTAEDAKLSAKEAKKLEKKHLENVATQIERVGDENDETIEMTNAMTIENEEDTKSGKTFNPVNRRHHMVIIPKTAEALLKVFRLVSKGYVEGFYRFPRVDRAMLAEACSDQKDIIVTSACLHPDTAIITSQGALTIKTAINKIKSGEELFVLSHNFETEKSEFQKITWGDVTRKQAKLLQIKLKTGQVLKLTPDHKVFTNKGWLEAKDLTKEHKLLKIMDGAGCE